MSAVSSFPPAAAKNAEILILGSMPGAASLAANQYYAHPRNQFWPLMAALLGRDAAPVDYAGRLEMLCAHRIALWDVIGTCVRPGSLDSAITDEIANDLPGFLAAHPHIRIIGFNGQKAQASFNKHSLPALPDAGRYEFHGLPSTSPAHASLDLAAKADLWRRALFHVK